MTGGQADTRRGLIVMKDDLYEKCIHLRDAKSCDWCENSLRRLYLKLSIGVGVMAAAITTVVYGFLW